MAAQQASRTDRTQVTVDAVPSPRPSGGPRTDRGLAVFAAVGVAVVLTALAPAVTVGTAVAAGVVATAVTAVRSVAHRSKDPPGDVRRTREQVAHAAD